jgi:ubiquinone/menaquinone biosynthesis C-methylase UbiE
MGNADRKRLIQQYYSRRARDYDRQKSRTWNSAQGFSNEISFGLLSALKDFESKYVLEVGVGSGRNASPLIAEIKPEFIGLDLSREMLTLAKAKVASFEKVIGLIFGDAEHLPFRDRFFDAVVCMSTMHYFASQERVLSEFSKILKEEGLFVYGDLTVHESDEQGFFEAMERMLSKAHAGYYKPSEIKEVLEASGFCVSQIKTFAYRKPYQALIEDKGRYFNVKSKTLQEIVHNASPDAKEQYALSNTELTLFYTMITASKKDQTSK